MSSKFGGIALLTFKGTALFGGPILYPRSYTGCHPMLAGFNACSPAIISMAGYSIRQALLILTEIRPSVLYEITPKARSTVRQHRLFRSCERMTTFQPNTVLTALPSHPLLRRCSQYAYISEHVRFIFKATSIGTDRHYIP